MILYPLKHQIYSQKAVLVEDIFPNFFLLKHTNVFLFPELSCETKQQCLLHVTPRAIPSVDKEQTCSCTSLKHRNRKIQAGGWSCSLLLFSQIIGCTI